MGQHRRRPHRPRRLAAFPPPLPNAGTGYPAAQRRDGITPTPAAQRRGRDRPRPGCCCRRLRTPQRPGGHCPGPSRCGPPNAPSGVWSYCDAPITVIPAQAGIPLSPPSPQRPGGHRPGPSRCGQPNAPSGVWPYCDAPTTVIPAQAGIPRIINIKSYRTLNSYNRHSGASRNPAPAAGTPAAPPASYNRHSGASRNPAPAAGTPAAPPASYNRHSGASRNPAPAAGTPAAPPASYNRHSGASRNPAS